MPLKIVKVEQLTRPTRQKQSVVTSLPEFIEATLKLSHGLKPQEGIEITLPKKNERGYKHIAFGMKKHLRAYLDRVHGTADGIAENPANHEISFAWYTAHRISCLLSVMHLAHRIVSSTRQAIEYTV